MFGLMYLIFFAVYLLVSTMAVHGAISYARKRGKSTKRWGWGAAFLMYNLVFWDWIPTVAVHQFYCAKDSGFWVYKTLDQWKAENPGVAKTLIAYKGARSKEERFDDGNGRTDTYFLSDRFNWLVTQQDIFPWLPIIKVEQQVMDVAKHEVLARYVDFGAGSSIKNRSTPLRFWLHNGNCSGGDRNKGLMYSFEHNVRGAEK